MPDVIIIGAGLTGLSTAFFLDTPYIILEKEDHIGGLCRSDPEKGYTFDYSGHFLHLRDREMKRLFTRLMPGQLKEVAREAFVYTNKTYVPYPFQANLHALPDRIKRECLDGFLRAGKYPSSGTQNFYRWSLSTFGKGITRHFMQPYNEKLWTVSSRRLSSDWVSAFVPRPSVEEIRQGAVSPLRKDFGYNVRFRYPAKGGCQSIIDAFGRRVAQPHRGVASRSIDLRRRTVRTSTGETLPYSFLVSTQPLPELMRQIEDLPAAVRRAAQKLDWNSVACFNLAFRDKDIGTAFSGRHWVYFPESAFPFYRVGMYTNVASSMAPRGYQSMYVEVSCRPGAIPPASRLLPSILEGLRNASLISRTARPVLATLLPIPYAYVIYDAHRADAVKTLQEFLKGHGIISIGRYGAWEYSFMERSVLQARAAAESLRKAAPNGILR